MLRGFWSFLGRFPRLKRLVVAALILLALPFALAPLYNFFWPVSTQMIWRRITLKPVERRWAPLAEVSPSLVVAVVGSEDGRFCRHYGVDFGALKEVIEEALEDGASRGASTITMQVARNLFLWQGRSYVRKALEIPLALWIDLVMPKRRILELYLNVAEWGDGVFGIAAASRKQFNKSQRTLDMREAALLATSLPAPKRRNAGQASPGHRRLAANLIARSERRGVDVTCLSGGS